MLAHLRSYLVTTLAGLNVHYFTHFHLVCRKLSIFNEKTFNLFQFFRSNCFRDFFKTYFTISLMSILKISYFVNTFLNIFIRIISIFIHFFKKKVFKKRVKKFFLCVLHKHIPDPGLDEALIFLGVQIF